MATVLHSTVPSAAKFATTTPTRDIAEWLAGFDHSSATASAYSWAKHTFLDWLGVTVGGAHEPLTDILVADALAEGATGKAHLIGRNEQVTPSQAALINGSASHALDYDDVHMILHGHPSVPVLPALLALAEQRNASGRDLLTAFIAGYEVECLIAAMIGDSHYETGWHNTATLGTFGAAAACAQLLKLNAEQTEMALAIAATQAAGLKAMFGTMSKPLHAGKAAFNGLLAARLASRGFTGQHGALECPQGFAATQSLGEFKPLPIRPDPTAPFAIEANLFKYHAACYLTHSPIEAVAALREEHQLTPGQVAKITLIVSPGHLNVCNILSPQSGLEIKFSLRHTAALALSGEDTAAMNLYNDTMAQRDDLVALRERVHIETKRFPQRTGTEVTIELNDGRTLTKAADVGIPATDLDQQWRKLTHKFHSVADPILGIEHTTQAIEHCQQLDKAESLQQLLATVTK